MMRYCASFLVVEAMRRGAKPEEACGEAIERIVRGEGRPPQELSANLVAINAAGEVGAAGTDAGFRYAVVTRDTAEVRAPLHYR
jgi:N4-(beta-N-acetylglucosaminyl)-L-asparaginase